MEAFDANIDAVPVCDESPLTQEGHALASGANPPPRVEEDEFLMGFRFE